MTLHEAIERLLRAIGQPLTTQEIADHLNQNGWYHRQDGADIPKSQISARINKYPHLFNRDGANISLAG